ncbi:tRNA lysidine(34) synthetase TilS [Marimonas sp. MJW-29]|uniref:tRNA(Ile)-lysidine synthase n=1 Tax=Sulfitobacter sediminis TaxID=3234186 RepID=A0ABV3RJW4_9RHOB
MGIAVSGGSDSMALLHLMREFCEIHKIELHAVTVDHRLRPEAATEADKVARHCTEIGVPHDTLVWEDWSGQGNLQQAARNARYAKIADWAQQYGIHTVAVAHTADDQAETVLMRLQRRSGVDGLSAMQARTVREGITWVRPLLKTRRETLRAYLRNNHVPWIDDPSNDDDRFDRIKARKALRLLSDLGIDANVLSEVADHLSQARRALDWQTFLAAKQIVEIEAGAIVIDETGLRLQPDEIQRRLIVRAIGWLSGAQPRPRRAAVATVMAALKRGQAGTLSGCHIRRIAARIWIFREYHAVRDLCTRSDALWDDRWWMYPSYPAEHDDSLCIRALGPQGLEQCPDWRASGRPHVVLQSVPGVWQGDKLISAPLAGFAENWAAELEGGPDAFFAALLSH